MLAIELASVGKRGPPKAIGGGSSPSSTGQRRSAIRLFPKARSILLETGPLNPFRAR
jgi:hypothetical protein